MSWPDGYSATELPSGRVALFDDTGTQLLRSGEWSIAAGAHGDATAQPWSPPEGITAEHRGCLEREDDALFYVVGIERCDRSDEQYERWDCDHASRTLRTRLRQEPAGSDRTEGAT